MATTRATPPPRLRRADSFLGIHFDFHAGDDCKDIGQRVTPGMVAAIIDQVRPDFLQCDCKGHRGLCSYPTKVGHPAPGFVRDPLRIWRDATARRGVGLYMHYSGVYDVEAVRRHPSWARIDAQGKRDRNNTSVFGPYVDKLLIPQLKELSDVYGVDGVWVDGECWSTEADYGPEALKRFRRETGIRNVPRKPTDPHYAEFREFCRAGFRRYLARYVDALHAHDRRFQIASNWAYSSLMPGPVDTAVDYLSGDYSLQNSVNSARIEGRCIAAQRTPWDLMAWSFSGKWGEGAWTTKSIPQLQQEAATVLALGGGFQAYFTQRRDASARLWQMKLMADVASFCRARQPFCHRAQAVPQVALLYSETAFYRKVGKLFAPWAGELNALKGTLQALLESQLSVEILGEHHLAGRMRDYPLIVIPEWDILPPRFRKELLTYVRAGGNLLVIGPLAAALFEKELGVRLLGKPEVKPYWLAHGGWLGVTKTLAQQVELRKGTRAFGRLHKDNDPTSDFQPAASIARCGKGWIAGVYANFGQRYIESATTVARDFMGALVRELFPRPMVDVKGSHRVDVCLNRIAGKLAVNLVNTSGPHADANVFTFDEVPSVGPLDLTIRTGRRPKRITREPAGKALRFVFRQGEVSLTLPRLEIHDVILVE